jgi:hypothetical protein
MITYLNYLFTSNVSTANITGYTYIRSSYVPVTAESYRNVVFVSGKLDEYDLFFGGVVQQLRWLAAGLFYRGVPGSRPGKPIVILNSWWTKGTGTDYSPRDGQWARQRPYFHRDVVSTNRSNNSGLFWLIGQHNDITDLKIHFQRLLPIFPYISCSYFCAIFSHVSSAILSTRFIISFYNVAYLCQNILSNLCIKTNAILFLCVVV